MWESVVNIYEFPLSDIWFDKISFGFYHIFSYLNLNQIDWYTQVEAITKLSKSSSSSTFSIDTTCEDPFDQTDSPILRSDESTSLRNEHEDDTQIIWFQDHENVDGIPNVALPLIITSIIANHCVSGILVDDGSSCNLIYFRIFTKLDLKEQDLRSCKDQSLLAFNDYSTHPCRHMYLISHLGKNG